MKIKIKKANDSNKKYTAENSFSFYGKPYMNEYMYFDIEDVDDVHFMTPDKYIELCAKLHGLSPEQVVASRKDDKMSFRLIEQAANNGTLTIPHIDYERKRQDGLHRVMWAKSKGIKEIPVFLFNLNGGDMNDI